MMVRVDPPIDGWSGALSGPGAVVATGHQAFCWHPGILSKLIAMRVAAERFGCRARYVVVDQDAHDALTFAQPRVEGERLGVEHLRLGEQNPNVPTGFHPPVRFDLSGVQSERVRDALGAAEGDTLAQQMTSAIVRLIEPIVGPLDVVYVSGLPRAESYQRWVAAMIADARRCAESYNAAVRDAGLHDVPQLRVDDDAVELPLWGCAWQEPRRRVLVRDGRVDPSQAEGTLLPRALALSAFMRSSFADLFIHGTGGRTYDRATEAWWRNWRGGDLRPMATATADLTLDFDVPVATRDQLAGALWRRHHLRHNMDPHRKHQLLAAMDQTDDRAQRRAIFHRIGALNRELIAANPQPMREAEAAARRARLGVANAQAAARRDWCVGLYPIERLADLRRAVAGSHAGDTMPA